MQIKLTTTLESVLAAACREARLRHANNLSSDHLMLGLLAQEEGHAMGVLRRLLQEWEIQRIRLRIGAEAGPLLDGSLPADLPSAHATTVDRLIEVLYRHSERTDCGLHTGDLLRAVVDDHASFSARLLMLYHVTAFEVRPLLEGLPVNEDYYPEMRFLAQLANDQTPRRDAIVRPETTADTSNATDRSALARYGVDLKARAAAGSIDRVVGREAEIDRMIRILVRCKKNNPVLIGDPGVGKTAVVEGLALRMAEGNVPCELARKRLIAVDMARLIAGTKFRGEFEERLVELVREAKRVNAILFFDELHTIVGAGGPQGTLDAANLLKPALSRGEVQCIGATTLDEFRRHIESDGALERRFQQVVIAEPTAMQTLKILYGLRLRYQRHHGVHYADDALEACVRLAERYMPERFFPDKAIDLLDEAGSRARMQSHGEVSGCAATGRLYRTVEVSADDVADVAASITGVPTTRMTRDERLALQHLEDRLLDRVVGQDDAVRRVVQTIRRNRSGLGVAERPLGVFLFVGPTGVGKTFLAKELSHALFGDSDGLIRFDMSEYAESHSVSRLVGSPPGYVGYGEGGQLTERVRRRPYSVVLFDEIEKAHGDVFNLLLQLLDEGRLTDGAGRRVDFCNTVVIMTSNVGAREMSERPSPLGFRSDRPLALRADEKAYRNHLERRFAPEFINRIDHIVVFRRMSEQDLLRIVAMEIERLSVRMTELNHTLSVDSSVSELLIAEGYDGRYGVRSLKRAVAEWIEDPLADLLLSDTCPPTGCIEVGCHGGRIELQVLTAERLCPQKAS